MKRKRYAWRRVLFAWSERNDQRANVGDCRPTYFPDPAGELMTQGHSNTTRPEVCERRGKAPGVDWPGRRPPGRSQWSSRVQAENSMTLYLSGPMTGRLDWNYPAFHAAAKRLRAAGHVVFNPAENFDGETHHPRHVYVRMDLRAVLDADAVAVLPGWFESAGARLEVAVARECGKSVLRADTLEPIPDRVWTSMTRL